MDYRSVAPRIDQLLSRAETIIAFCHEKPDGDAIASLLAFKYMIEHKYHGTVRAVSIDGVPQAFTFLPHHEDIQQDFLGGSADLLVTLDCGDLKRTGFSARIQSYIKKGIPLINIDHHPKNDLHKLATENIVSYSAASTTHILYHLSEELDIKIAPVLSTYLFTGLYTDTGSFQHSVTTPDVLRVASLLLAKGARMRELRINLSMRKPVSRLKLWGLVLDRMRVNKWGLTVSVVTRKDLDKTGAVEDDISGLVSMLESHQGCTAALLLSEVEDGVIRGSLRSNKSKVDVSRIAKVFGGGGHAKASGFVFPGHIRVDKRGWNIV